MFRIKFEPVSSRNADDLRHELPPREDVRVLVDHLDAVLESPLMLHVLGFIKVFSSNVISKTYFKKTSNNEKYQKYHRFL